MGLDDAMLVKENQIALVGGVGEAVRRALERRLPDMPLEVECRTLEDVSEALDAGATHLLLDNMGPAELREAAELAGGRATLEASGGFTPQNIRSVVGTGLQFVSVGAITHSAVALDLSMTIEPL
jgi:nicotinate-nucleotide pyrophosphorylase (carboxylating)